MVKARNKCVLFRELIVSSVHQSAIAHIECCYELLRPGSGPLHMSPVDWAGPVSEILAHPLIPLKKYRRVHMRKRAGSVAEISVFPTGISESGLKVAI